MLAVQPLVDEQRGTKESANSEMREREWVWPEMERVRNEREREREELNDRKRTKKYGTINVAQIL